jgi:methylenetetrahydrofolate dehydrogenase (NADP+)/methenyltetrahydrofolate cyclohydrolase
MIKEGAVLVDFGGTFIEDPVTKKRRTVGDVDYDGVKDKAGAVTPVPGGVGPMLVTMLMWSTVNAARMAARPI